MIPITMSPNLLTILLMVFLPFRLNLASGFEPAKEDKPPAVEQSKPVPRVKFTVKLETVLKHDDGKFLWFHPRPVAIPGLGEQGNPLVLLTLQQHLHVSDHYSGLHMLLTSDLGKTWTGPVLPKELDWVSEPGPPPVHIAVADVTPHWHSQSGKVIAVGAQVRYSEQGDQLSDLTRAHQTAYAVFDPKAKTWTTWRVLQMPEDKHFDYAYCANAQGVVEPDGTLLLPFYIGKTSAGPFSVVVARCKFTEGELRFQEAGNILSLSVEQGLVEPSLIKHAGRYFLTLRNNKAGYVTTSPDGLNFAPIRPWKFDDGQDLGNYDTQQHWVAHRDGLFLSYTRRGLNNDHVFRHRAPLLFAQIDPDRLVVLRDTEQIIMPDRGATFGNFGAARITDQESWITDAEGVFFPEAKQRGAEGITYLARIKWEVPNVEAEKPAAKE